MSILGFQPAYRAYLDKHKKIEKIGQIGNYCQFKQRKLRISFFSWLPWSKKAETFDFITYPRVKFWIGHDVVNPFFMSKLGVSQQKIRGKQNFCIINSMYWDGNGTSPLP